MSIDRNPVITYGNFNAPLGAVHRSCEELYNRVAREKGGAPELLMFFIKGKSPIMYEHIKSYCDTVRGVQSQAVDSFNAMKKGGDRAFHANLLLKVNSKLGGMTVTLSSPVTNSSVPTVFTPLCLVSVPIPSCFFKGFKGYSSWIFLWAFRLIALDVYRG
jgi:hypothetical protein